MYGAWSCGTDFNLLNLLWFSLLFSYSGLLSAQCTLVWAQKMPNVLKKWFWWWISFLIYMRRQQRITVQHVCPQHVAPVHVMFKSDQLLKNTDRQIYPVHEWHATSIWTAHVYNVYQWQNKCCVSFEMAEVIFFIIITFVFCFYWAKTNWIHWTCCAYCALYNLYRAKWFQGDLHIFTIHTDHSDVAMISLWPKLSK